MPSEASDPGRARPGRPGYDRDQILSVAVEVFNTHGFDATPVSALAARLGVTKSALYHHFESKDAVLEAALEEALGGLEAALAQVQRSGLGAADQVRALVRGAVGVLVDKLPYVTLLLRVRGNSPVERAALERRRAFDHEVGRIVRAAQDEGLLRADIDPAVATRLVFGMVNSVVEWYRPGGPVDPDTLADDILHVVLDGLQAGDA